MHFCFSRGVEAAGCPLGIASKSIETAVVWQQSTLIFQQRLVDDCNSIFTLIYIFSARISFRFCVLDDQAKGSTSLAPVRSVHHFPSGFILNLPILEHVHEVIFHQRYAAFVPPSFCEAKSATTFNHCSQM